jgi:hypothetical protein
MGRDSISTGISGRTPHGDDNHADEHLQARYPYDEQQDPPEQEGGRSRP